MIYFNCTLEIGEEWEPSKNQFGGNVFSYIPNKELIIKHEHVLGEESYNKLKRSKFKREEIYEKRKLSMEEKIDYLAFSISKERFSQVAKM